MPHLNIMDLVMNASSQWIFAALPAVVLLVHLGPYLLDAHRIRANGITGPLLAKFSDAWYAWVAAHGHISDVVHRQHKKYGPFVRLAPNHVSISEPDALRVVYAHGNGALKSGYYDAFHTIQENIFSTRSRLVHARKRKVVSHIFSQKSVLDFEPFIRLHVGELFEQWDKLCKRSQLGFSGGENEGNWRGHGDRVWFNCMLWFSYWSFDVIGDLAFGSPFGMIRNAKDITPAAANQKAAMAEYGLVTADPQDISQPVCASKEVSAVETLTYLSETGAPLGALPAWWRPIARLLPRYSPNSQATNDFAGMTVAAVAKRLASPTDRADLLSKLLEGKDEDGRPMGREELTAEALTILIAGSDTLSNSSCAIVSYVAGNPLVQTKLQKELDEAMGDSDDPVTTYAQVKRLPYLEAVINEGLRLHSTVGLGLPRVIPKGGLTVCGKTFTEGTILSVPTYTIHRDPRVWGTDADIFRPERWLECDQANFQKVFNPFSYGPRACVGQNLAMIELHILMSSIFRRYDIVLEQPNSPLEVVEGFVRRPVAFRIGMKRRNF